MKFQKLTISILALLFISCEKTQENDKNFENLQTISNNEAENISESFELEDAELLDGIDETFGLYGQSVSKAGNRVYIDSIGTWRLSKSIKLTRVDSVKYRNGRFVIRDVERSAERLIEAKFRAANDSFIKNPKSDSIVVNSISISRKLSYDATIIRKVFNNNEEVLAETEKVANRDKNHQLSLERHSSIEGYWYATLSGEKDIQIERTRKDVQKELNRSYTISSNNLIVQNIKSPLKRFSKIVSGTIDRTIIFTDHKIKISTEFFERSDSNTIRYIRSFYKNDETDAFKIITVSYN